MAHDLMVSDISQTGPQAVFTMTGTAPLSAAGISSLAGIYGARLRFRAGKDRLPAFLLDVRGRHGRKLLDEVRQFLTDLAPAVQTGEA